MYWMKYNAEGVGGRAGEVEECFVFIRYLHLSVRAGNQMGGPVLHFQFYVTAKYRAKSMKGAVFWLLTPCTSL
jgi:hypothetical protein